MVNVSKNALAKEMRTHLRKELVDLFIANTTKRDFGKLLFELLSPAERIMLEKRAGIIGLLSCDYSAYEISQLLKVSTSTIWHIEERLDAGHYAHIQQIFHKKRARASVLHFLGSIMALGFPGVASAQLRSKIRRDAEAFRAGG